MLAARLIRVGAEDVGTPIADRKYDLLKAFSARKNAMTSSGQAVIETEEAIQAVKAKTDPSKHELLDALQKYITDQIISNGMSGKELIEIAENRDMVSWGCNLPAMVKRKGILFQHVNGHGTYNKLLNSSGSRKFEKDPADTTKGWLKPIYGDEPLRKR